MTFTEASPSEVLKQDGGVEPLMVAIRVGGTIKVMTSALVHPFESVTNML